MKFRTILFFSAALCLAVLYLAPVHANADKEQTGSPGFSGEFSASMDEVLQAVDEVLKDQIIHGTFIFDKDPTLTGAEAAPSTSLFPRWQGPGQAFYKVRKDAIAPRHFFESADQGTIAVRYIVTATGPQRTRIHIDAVYVENTHRRVHPSDGSVESSEYKEIQEHLRTLQEAAQEAADIKRRRDSADLVKQTIIRRREDETTLLASTQTSVQELEGRLKSLRLEVERRVKAPGADLKTAPFQSAAKVESLAAYSEVLIVIVTPHWYGVETSQGQRGWVPVEQVEPLP